MRIGVLSERTGVSTKTIRYYEDIGVLPEPSRAPNGYREYDESAVERLGFVQAAQAVGLTLGEIRGVIEYRNDGTAPCVHVVDLIRHRAEEIDEQIADLERMRGELRRLERRARTLSPDDCAPSHICHVIPR